VSLLSERYGLASASDIARFKPQLEEWVSVLIDELADTLPDMEENMSDKKRKNIGRSLADTISVELVSLTSGMTPESRKEIERRETEKSHQAWDKKRKRRGSGVSHYGDYQGGW
jgi:hypothetical protein